MRDLFVAFAALVGASFVASSRAVGADDRDASRSAPPTSTAIAPVDGAATTSVDEQLARLASDRALDRIEAQTWLAAHLTPDDRARLETAVAKGNEEVRGRVVEALASEDRHVGLAVDLATSTAPTVRAVGESALVESIERWSPGSSSDGIVGGLLVRTLRESRDLVGGDELLQVDAELARAPLAYVTETIVRFGPVGVELVVDPRCRLELELPAAPILGTYDSVLAELIVRHGVSARGYGIGDAAPAGSTRIVVFGPRGLESPTGTGRSGDQDLASGPELRLARRIAGWCVDVARDPASSSTARSARDATWRAAAARAVVATGWPAGVAWLAERWRTTRDAAAFEGLAAAARRGHVASTLVTSEGQRALRAELDRRLADANADPRDALGIAQALGATGCVGLDGEDLVGPALRDVATLTGRALHARVIELESRSCAGPEWGAVLDAIATRDDVAPATVWMALLARVRTGVAPPALARPRELVEWADERGWLADPVTFPANGPAFPPEAWRTPAGLPTDWTRERASFVAAAWLVRGDVDAAVAIATYALDPTATDVEPVGLTDRRLRAARRIARVAAARGDDTVARFAGRLIDDGRLPRPLALRFAMLSGVDVSEARVDEFLRSLGTPIVDREELLTLAAASVGAQGERVRRLLLVAIKGSCAPDDAIEALDAAVARLRAARDEAGERAFARDVREHVRSARNELRPRVRVDSWPAPPKPVPTNLGDFDRSFRRAGW